MPHCFTCRRECKNSTPRLHVCSDCVSHAESTLNDSLPWSPFLPASIHADVSREGFSKCFKNSRYTVLWRDVENPSGTLVHLSIKRNDKNPLHDWRDLQRIKNEILGAEEEAMELYPSESRLVDAANQYHLWCFRGMSAPFGYKSQRCVMEDVGDTGGKQREFEHKPEDLLTEEQYNARLMEFRQKEITRAGLLGQLKSILDEAEDDSCQNPILYHEKWKCEDVKAESPGSWCGPCMARLLKKLAIEAGVLPC